MTSGVAFTTGPLEATKTFTLTVTNAAGVTAQAAVTVTVPAYAAFGDTGAMSTSRTAFTATLLKDGRVLIAGGYDANSELDTAEIYDPAANGGQGGFKTLAARMTSTRYRHTATLLPSGKVLIAGGYDENHNARNTVEIFDPAFGGGAGGFLSLRNGTLTTKRGDHTAVSLNDGRVLLVGGAGGNILKTAETFDPAASGGAGTFTATGFLHFARINNTLTRLADGRVLVTGGDQGGNSTSAEIFDPAGNGGVGSWTDAQSMAERRYFHRAALLPDGRVLVAGGADGWPLSTSEVFDPAASGGTGAFAASGAMGSERSRHSVTMFPNGKLLVVGGTAGNATSEWYDPGSGAFSPGPALVHTRSDHEAVLLKDGTLLVVGGGKAQAEILR